MTVGEMFGWVQQILTQLGVWDLLGTVTSVGLMVTATMFLIRVVRSG